MVRGRWFDPTVVLAALLVVAGLGPTLASVRGAAAVDFYHFWLVGPAVRAGEMLDVYAPEARRDAGERGYQRAFAPGVGDAQRQAATKFRRLETTATPFLYASFAPFVSDDYDRDRIAFGVGSVLLFLLALGALAVRLGYGPTAVLLLLAFALLAFEPFASDVRVGNVNRLQFGLLTAYVLLLWGVGSGDRVRGGIAGLWLGLAIAWKPNLAFVAIAVGFYWATVERSRAWWSHATGVVAGGALAVVAASAFFGTPLVWVWWADAALDLPNAFPIPIEHGNFAPARALKQGWGVDLGFAWTAACVALLLLFLRTAAARRSAGEVLGEEIPLLVGLGCGVSLLASPLSWLHYYVLSLFLVTVVLRPTRGGRPLPAAYRGLGVVAVIAVSMGPVLQVLVASGPYRWAALGNGGLLALIGLAAFELLRPARQTAATPMMASSEVPAGTPIS